MKVTLKTIVLITIIFIIKGTSFSQCEYDLNNDGIVNFDQDYLLEISQFGLYQSELEPGTNLIADHNNNELSDIQDVLEFLPRLVSQECPETNPYSENIAEVLLVVHHEHTEDVTDAFNSIPAGSITYRLYLNVSEPDMVLMALFGDSNNPMEISSDGVFFHSETIEGTTILDGVASHQIDILEVIFPTLTYTSWLSLDWHPGDNESIIVSRLEAAENTWLDSFNAGDNILIDNPAGGGIVTPDYEYVRNSNPANLKLIAQITVLNSQQLTGNLNVLLKQKDFDDVVGVSIENLYFNSDNISVLGCTDPLAPEFNPEATFDDGSCTLSGDFNGDGEISMSDLLLLLSNFGCSIDCDTGDLNENGIINIDDLLNFLGLF